MPSLIPSPGARPTSDVRHTTFDPAPYPAVSAPYTVTAGTVIVGEVIDPEGAMPGPYYNPSFGSPVLFHDQRLTNQGTLWNWSDQGPVRALDVMALDNSGLIVAEGNGGDNYVFGIVTTTPSDNPGMELRHSNSGSIYAISHIGNAQAWFAEDPFMRLDNSGLIAAQATPDPGAFALQTGFAAALFFENGAQIYNTATGRILAEGREARAIWVGRGGYAGLPGGIIDNAGLIEASALAGGKPSVALWLGHLAVEQMIVTNSGTIRADRAIYAPSDDEELNFSIDMNGIEQINNTATGLIDGDVLLFNGDDIITNRGRIEGLIDTGKGEDSIDSAGGQIDGLILLGDGEDSFIGSTLADRVSAGDHADVVDGREGNDLLLGGFGDDTLTGGAGNDGLYGEFGKDVIITFGRDYADGGAGDDLIETDNLAFAFITGGDGNDSWQLGARNRLFDLSLIVASGRVAEMEAIRLGKDNDLIVRAADIVALTGGERQLTLFGDSSNQVTLVDGWSAAGTQLVDGVTFNLFTNGSDSVLAEGDVVVDLAASAPAGGFGLDAVGSGAVAPAPGGTSGLVLDDAVVDVMLYNSPRDIVIEQGVTWQNLGPEILINLVATIAPSGQIADDADILNDGVIHAENASGRAWAISILNVPQSDVVNRGTIEAIAHGDGFAWALESNGAGPSGWLDNSGTITARAEAGEAIAVLTAYASTPGIDPKVVVNSGLIEAHSTLGFASAIYAQNGADFENSGDLVATGGAGAVALYDYSSFGTQRIINSGNITAVSTSFDYLGIGILVDAGSHIVNSGQINGDIAISFTGAYGGALVLDNTGEINGAVLVDLHNTGENRVNNSGTINGNIEMGAGADQYLGVTGEVTGVVFAGDGDDILTGGAFSDYFEGGNGKDEIDGGGGDDIASYLTAEAGVQVNLALAGFQDTVGAGLDKLTSIETIEGSTFDDVLRGNALANRFFGDAGNDRFHGLGGADRFHGGLGDDTFYITSGMELLFENVDEGSDTARVSVASYTVGANVENIYMDAGSIILTGGQSANFIRGNTADNTIDGGLGADKLYGMAGNDRLIGGVGADLLVGGLGDDRMSGGTGNDSYFVDSLGDRVSEAVSDTIFNDAGGVDTVSSLVTFSLDSDAGTRFVERVKLIGTGDIDATGNDLANIMTGNGGANLLDGGPGDDKLFGGAETIRSMATRARTSWQAVRVTTPISSTPQGIRFAKSPGRGQTRSFPSSAMRWPPMSSGWC